MCMTARFAVDEFHCIKEWTVSIVCVGHRVYFLLLAHNVL